MPAALLRFLPHIGIALALGLAVWWIDHAGYGRAMADRDRRDAAMLTQVRAELRQSERRLMDKMAANDALFTHLIEGIDQIDRSTQSTIAREIARDPRLSDPRLGLSDGMLDAVNRARASGACAPGAAGRIVCTVPAAAEPGR